MGDLAAVPAFHRRRVIDEIERQLSRSPLVTSRTRKELAGVVPPWDQARPVWQLRVGEFRVFYDVDPERMRVIVQAVRRKGRKPTEEIL